MQARRIPYQLNGLHNLSENMILAENKGNHLELIFPRAYLSASYKYQTAFRAMTHLRVIKQALGSVRRYWEFTHLIRASLRGSQAVCWSGRCVNTGVGSGKRKQHKCISYPLPCNKLSQNSAVQNNTHFLSHSSVDLESRAQLSWVLVSASHQAAVRRWLRLWSHLKADLGRACF